MKNQRASVLLFSLFVVVIMAVMMMPVASYVGQSSRMAFGTRSSDRAFYAAEAGTARGFSYIFGVGSGTIAGIRDARFDATEAAPFYPFGNQWVTMEEGIVVDASAPLASKVSIWMDAGGSNWIVRSIGRVDRPKELYRTIDVTIGAGTFARYAFFNSSSHSAIDGKPRWLAAGESFNGPVHSNRNLYVYGAYNPDNPLTFNSDVTIVGDEVQSSNSNYQNVIYNGLKDTDANYVELPSDLSLLIAAAASGGIDLPNDDPWLETPPAAFTGGGDPNPGINNYKFVFASDGTVTYTNMDAAQYLEDDLGYSAAAAFAAASTTVVLNDTNGAIVVQEGNVFVSGTVNGRVTLAALANDASASLIGPFSTTVTDGNVIVDGNIIYNTHPTDGSGNYDIADDRTFDPGVVTDVLGIIAERNFALDGSMPLEAIIDAHIMITGQASPNPDVRDWGTSTGTINEAINQDGGFYVEAGNQRDLSELWTGIRDDEPGSGSPGGGWSSGDLYLTGGVVHFLRGQTGNGSAGYKRHYSFDSRLLTNPPPFYPLTPDLEVIGWRDVASIIEP